MQAKSAPDMEGFLDQGQSEWLRGGDTGELHFFILNRSSRRNTLTPGWRAKLVHTQSHQITLKKEENYPKKKW
jgi:hypothetical protein